jgi:hypothetical protein
MNKDTVSRLERAVTECADEKQPWLLRDTVAQAVSDSPDAAALFESIWSCGMDELNWNFKDLNQCAVVATDKINLNFPGLSGATVRFLVNAMAYEWK